MKKFTKRISALILMVIMAFCCIPTAFASETTNNFEKGVVLVGFNSSIEKIQDIAPELDIERIELAQMDNDYIPYINSANFRFIKITLTEKTVQATFDAIEILKTKPEVIVAEPYYTVYTKYNPGDVIISLYMNSNISAIIDEILQDYPIDDFRLLTPGSTTQKVYCITFKEKTKEIVTEVLPLLKSCDQVKIAELNFIREFTVVPITGDADKDRNLTIMDATVIQKVLAKEIKPSEIDCEAAVVSGNYYLSIADATLIQRKLAGLDSTF